MLTLISNTSATPISGTFSNLPDGSIVTINGNNFQASYSGGDGNDLTLTVVPQGSTAYCFPYGPKFTATVLEQV